MITAIRNFLKQQNIQALIITRTDSFLGEYYPPEKNQLLLATGFSGSAGMAVVTLNRAVLFVDARYTEQAKSESQFEVLEIPTQTTPSEWLKNNLPDTTIGYYTEQRSAAWVSYMTLHLKTAGIHLKGLPKKIWETLFTPQNEMTPPDEFDYDLSYCGLDTNQKINQVTGILKEHHLEAFLFASPDSVSWILNKRSLWVHEYPVIFKRLIVFADGSYHFLSEDTIKLLENKTIGADLTTLSQALCERLKNENVRIQNIPDVVAPLKAIKNQTEQNNIRQACLSESIVICRFLAWIEQSKNHITEWDCDIKLQQLRSENPLYRGDSFDTIAASGEHAARAHYHATEKTATLIASEPLLMVDTGGNYLNGTTDMTRTICTGKPTELMKRRYTQVLKGHIALTQTKIKSGDLPRQLDQNAHSFLRADGVDYLHATGHGIGMFLDVHEAPPIIHEKSDTPIVAGMLFSNEPAYYDACEGFGIRLENMILTQNGEEDFLNLENLIWVPFDGRLVDFSLLTVDEKKWLQHYHQTILDRIVPCLSSDEQKSIRPLLDFFTQIQ